MRMSAPAARLIVRICWVTVLILIVGTMAVFGFQIIEPMYANFGEPPGWLGWGEPGAEALLFSSVGMLGVMLVLVLFVIFAPIREDIRQQTR